MTTTIAGIRIPDSTMARAATELVRDTEPDLLYNHSRRVFLFGALTGERRQLAYDAELLYIGAMFHDMGLIDAYSSPHDRFEVDGANAARDFLKGYGIGEQDIEHDHRGSLARGPRVGLAGQMRGAQLHEQDLGQPEIAQPK